MTQEQFNLDAPLTADEQLAVFNMNEDPIYVDTSHVRDARGRLISGPEGDGSDEALNVQFTIEPVYNKLMSHRAGTAQYSDMEFVSIIPPGDMGKLSTVHTPVTEFYKWRFPLEYANFKKGLGELITGTPLSQWPVMKPSQIKTLEASGIRTVEQLATLSDSNAGTMRGFHSLKTQAQQFLAAAKDSAVAGAMQAELEAVKESARVELDAMKAQMAEMLALMQSTKSAPVADETETPAPKMRFGKPVKQ